MLLILNETRENVVGDFSKRHVMPLTDLFQSIRGDFFYINIFTNATIALYGG